MAQPEQSSVPPTHDAPNTPVTPTSRPRLASRIGKAPPQPTSVKINVEGAFIVNEETINRNGESEYVHWEHKDIRLPHHTDVVSHVAVDVSTGTATTKPSRSYESILTPPPIDRRLPRQTSLLLPRTRLPHRRRPSKLPKLRNRPHRRMHLLHQRAQRETIPPQWRKTRRPMYHGDRRRCLPLLR